MQSLHAVLPVSDVNVPGWHCWHVGCCGVALKSPGRHGAGAVEPVAHDEPAGQDVHSDASPRWDALE